MPYILCDVDEDDEIAHIDLVYARCMSLHGHRLSQIPTLDVQYAFGTSRQENY